MPFYQKADVFIAPFRIARGVQNKVLQALACGLPVITTRLGLEGIKATPGEDVLVADTEQELFDTLNKIRPYCRWTSGTWEGLGWKWNEVQSIPSHINKLSEYLCRIERELRLSKK